MKISDELQELVNSNKLDLEEAQLLHSIRTGEIENPIKQEKEPITRVYQVDEALSKANTLVDLSKNLIQKFDKAIEMLNNPEQTLFNYEEFLSPEDKNQLSVLNNDLKVLLVKESERLEVTINNLNILKEKAMSYAVDTQHLFSSSPEINDKKIEQALKEHNDKKIDINSKLST